ncbi:hypothetical protein D3C72_1444000 [compost metagenome]
MCLIVSSQARAALDYGLELGARQQSGDVAGANFSANTRVGMQAGAFAHIPMEGGVAHFRTGLLYTQRPLESESDITGQKIQYNLDYLDIPIEILFKAHEKFGMYLGFAASININKSCSGDTACKMTDIDTPYFPFVFGGIVKFNPKWGLDIYFDGANGAVAKGLGNYKSFGVNLMYSMD